MRPPALRRLLPKGPVVQGFFWLIKSEPGSGPYKPTQVTRKCFFKFEITANFVDEVELDVVPLDISGVVLGSPYLYD